MSAELGGPHSLARFRRPSYNVDMDEIVDARSGGAHFKAALDFDRQRWEAVGEPPPAEGEFPFTAELDGRRYELYSDETFDEVELAADEHPDT
jgi:hypothetical protein